MFFKHHAATKAWQDDRSAAQCIVTNKLVQRCFSLHTRCVGLWYGTADEKVSTSHLCFSVTIGAAISAEQSGANIQADHMCHRVMQITLLEEEKNGKESIISPPIFCTLTPGCDQDGGWMFQPHAGFHPSCNGREKNSIKTKQKAVKNSNTFQQFQFSCSNEIGPVAATLPGRTSRPPGTLRPRDCSTPGLEQATAGLRRPQTHEYLTSHLSTADSRTLADRRLHAGSRLCSGAVSAQLLTGLPHWRDRMSPANAQTSAMKTTRWVQQTTFPGLLTVTTAQTYLALPCKYAPVFVIERARLPQLSPHARKWVILMDDRPH